MRRPFLAAAMFHYVLEGATIRPLAPPSELPDQQVRGWEGGAYTIQGITGSAYSMLGCGVVKCAARRLSCEQVICFKATYVAFNQQRPAWHTCRLWQQPVWAGWTRSR